MKTLHQIIEEHLHRLKLAHKIINKRKFGGEMTNDKIILLKKILEEHQDQFKQKIEIDWENNDLISPKN